MRREGPWAPCKGTHLLYFLLEGPHVVHGMVKDLPRLLRVEATKRVQVQDEPLCGNLATPIHETAELVRVSFTLRNTTTHTVGKR